MTTKAQLTQLAERVDPFIAVPGQCFRSHRDWVAMAQYRLTAHPNYNNTEHGDQKGWRGSHFTAMCFDQQGRRCLNGGDMRRADEEGAFPVWWIWPDQVAELVMGDALARAAECGE